MLDAPMRIFRCYICVENHIRAPLTDMSLLIEHLAMHFDFHLFECHGCCRKFVTPFLANFHIKEGRCKREEGELCDDGGAPLKVVDLDTIEFKAFCRLQNAITRCTELMLYELNCGEADLAAALKANRLIPKCPNSPDPIIRRESEVQTCPPSDLTTTVVVEQSKAAPTTPISVPVPHSEKSPSDMSLASTSTSSIAHPGPVSRQHELAEGCSFISDDEVEELAKLPLVNTIEVDNGLSTVSNSPSSSPVPGTFPEGEETSSQRSHSTEKSPPPPPPESILPPPPPPPVLESSASSTSSGIPSLLSLTLRNPVDIGIPPRHDVRQNLIVPERPQAPPPTNYAEADSSSSVASQLSRPFFFQAPPAKPKRTVSNPKVSSLNDAVYPVLNPVYSGGVQVFPGQPQVLQGQGYLGSIPHSDEPLRSCQQPRLYGGVPQSVGEVSSSTNCLPFSEELRSLDALPAFSQHREHRERSLSPIRVSSPVRGHLPLDFMAEGISTVVERSEAPISGLSIEEDGYPIDIRVLNMNGSGPSRLDGEPIPSPTSASPKKWFGCEGRSIKKRRNGFVMRQSRKISRNVHGEKQRYSYGIKVVTSFDPHSGTSIAPRKRRGSSGRHSRALSRDRLFRIRSRTTGPPRSRASRSRSPRISRRRLRSPSHSPAARSNSVERSRHRRRHGSGKEKFNIFGEWSRDDEVPSSSCDSEGSKHRIRSRSRSSSSGSSLSSVEEGGSDGLELEDEEVYS